MKLLKGTDQVWCEETYIFRYRTERALLIQVRNDLVWIPKSQNIGGNIPYDNGEGQQVVDICIPQWLADEKGMT